LSYDSVINGLVFFGPEVFERAWALLDASPWRVGVETLLVASPVSALLLVDYCTLPRCNWQWAWQRRASRLLIVSSLAYLLANAVILRGPWFLGRAGRSDRITVYTSLLSSTTAGAPLLAFTLAIGFGVTACCVAAACGRSFVATRPLDEKARTVHAELVIWVICAAIVVLGVASMAAFAAGGSI